MKNKSLFHQLKEQFFQHNRFSFSMAAGVSLLMGFGGVIVSWILKSLIDTASGTAGADTGVPTAHGVGPAGCIPEKCTLHYIYR